MKSSSWDFYVSTSSNPQMAVDPIFRTTVCITQAAIIEVLIAADIMTRANNDIIYE